MSEMLGRADMLCPPSNSRFVPTTEVATNSITSSAGEQGLRNGEAERLSSGKVDDEFKCFWYLDW
jgi:hypothetical protein